MIYSTIFIVFVLMIWWVMYLLDKVRVLEMLLRVEKDYTKDIKKFYGMRND